MGGMRLLSNIKNAVVPDGRAPRQIVTGAFARLTLMLDLHCHTQVWLGLNERELYDPLRRLSSGIRSAVDLGCAEGIFTAYFLAKTSAARIYSVDGNEEYLDALRQNLDLNGLSGTGRLVLRHEYLRSLDSFADQVERPCLVKMDIDGGEHDVLTGSPRFLHLDGIRWIIEVHSHGLERDCIAILQGAGYETTIVRNAWWRAIVPEQRPIALNRWITAQRPPL